MRLTTRTNLALRVLMTCGINHGEKLRTADIAERCNASVHHLLQVVHTLQEHEFIETLRGRSGGLKLARDSDAISIGEVFRIFESGTPFAECFAPDSNTCPLVGSCRLRNYIQRALDAFYHELDLITLQDLVRGNCGLRELLAMAPDPSQSCKGQMA
ncbi:MAG: Rrf2 family transcriptional regulator, nitric oxide-sensitive transcriptional repressor [Roseibaca calidilacus]|uniref:Rrf2 family transcriptional regulator, nitric oxide-sensitive transcriptional repressor n=1 Tax=Roseibaca calidilacus TaxID=1666912 RepID=A0A0P7WBP4_9RHOB|nr:Rrf2 family transcriptional regulator [Roseibaca calidilacus]KPP91611.1 MAG: Rrf2 family transcriptional regulator, nitric oxide-sensitive transcriptional repressor [Roseibaca calidilacus]CUX82827.1 transcriptional regulator, BadM/Rrf2 family [Roseibaca calidilacus]